MLRMDLKEVGDRERHGNGERLWERKGLKRKKTYPVSGPPYFKQTQINGSAIAFSKRTVDGAINEGQGSEDSLRRGSTLHWLFHTTLFQLSAGSYTYCFIHANPLMRATTRFIRCSAWERKRKIEVVSVTTIKSTNTNTILLWDSTDYILWCKMWMNHHMRICCTH